MIKLLSLLTILIALKLGLSLAHATVLGVIVFLINPHFLVLLMPILWFTPKLDQVYWLTLLLAALIWLFLKFKKNRLAIGLCLMLVFIYTSLLSGGLLNSDSTFNLENFWWGKPDVQLEIEALKLQALYLPYLYKAAYLLTSNLSS